MTSIIPDKIRSIKSLESPLFHDTERVRFLSKPFATLSDKIAFETPLHLWGIVCDYLGQERRSNYRIPKGSYIPLEDMSKAAFYSCDITSKKTGQTIGVHLTDQPINRFETDGVINAANESLLGGGGVDKRLHDGAGPNLVRECALHDGCQVGEAVITKGYDLPNKYVLHTVGPLLKPSGKGDEKALTACYKSSLELCDRYKLKSLAAPCVACGFYAFPIKDSARIVRKVLQDYVDTRGSTLKTVVLSLRTPVSRAAYQEEFSKKG